MAPEPTSTDPRPKIDTSKDAMALSVGEARRRRRFVFAAVMATTFMVAIEINIVATAMPSIVPQLGGFDLYSWVFAAFLLPQAVTVPIYGKLADMYGRRRILFVGIIGFLIASLLCGLATTMPELIAYRALQGFAGGAVLPVAHTIVGDIYTPEERARAQGYVATVWAASGILGPALGAVIVANLDWRWVFWINLPLGFVALAMLHAYYHETVEKRRRQIDFAGAGLLMVGSGCLMLALIQAVTYSNETLAGLIVIAAVCAAILWRVERRAPEPILPPSLWRIPVVSIATIGTIVASALAMGVVTYLPVHIQGVLGHSVEVVAVALATIALSWSFCAGVGGRLSIRTTYRLVISIGGAVLIAGTAGLIALPATASVAAIVGAGVLITMGLGFTTSTYVISVQTNVGWELRGTATSMIHFSRMFGQALGAASFGLVINLSLREGGTSTHLVETMMDPLQRAQVETALLDSSILTLGAALNNVYWLAGAIAVVGLIVGFRMPRGLNPATSLGSQNRG